MSDNVKEPLCRDCNSSPKAPGRSRCWPCYSDYRKGYEKAQHEKGMRVLLLDIETSPHLVYVWGMYNQNVMPNQIVEPTRMLSFAYKWLNEPGTHFVRGNSMTKQIRKLLHEADVVMHYNGNRFDVPHINREILQAGLTPPSPFRNIDLLAACRKAFRFPSNKLETVSNVLGIGGKVKHSGFDLWRRCMAGDEAAWEEMAVYNKRDVDLLEELYHVLLPWIPHLPNRNLYDGTDNCPACGADAVREDGFAYTPLSKYERWVCDSCGVWLRSSRRISGVKHQLVIR